MKTTSTKYIFLAVLMLTADLSYSQSKNASRIKVAYSQASDNSRYIEGSIVVRVKRYEALTDAPIEITRIEGEDELVIGTVNTNKNGEFRFKLEADINSWLNEEGKIEFSAAYKGNDTIRSASRSISVIPANLSISFKAGEDENVVEVSATKQTAEGEEQAIEDTKIDVYVKSLFSPLLIGSESTNARGVARVTFPDDLPGNREGELDILVKINEHDDFGTLAKEGKINWGIPYVPPEVKLRGLGDTDAPLWMVYTLIVLLSAVWFHYLYVIYMIYRIKTTK